MSILYNLSSSFTPPEKVLVTDNNFQPSLIYASKTGAVPGGASYSAYQGNLETYHEILNQAENFLSATNNIVYFQGCQLLKKISFITWTNAIYIIQLIFCGNPCQPRQEPYQVEHLTVHQWDGLHTFCKRKLKCIFHRHTL